MPRKPKQKTNGSIVPRDPAQLAERWHELAGEHFVSFEMARKFCNLVFEALIQDVEQSGTPTLFNTMDAVSVARVLKIAVEGERQALKMQFEDHNVAIQTVQQLGFIVTRPDGAIDVEFVEQDLP